MGSFKFRLVAYFVVLALMPVLAASWAFSEVAARGETGQVDSRLNAALRVAVARYADDVSEAAETASSLGRTPAVQRAFAARDQATLARLSRDVPRSAFYVGGDLLAGTAPRDPAAQRAAVVVSREGKTVGRIVIWVPLNDRLVRELGTSAGLGRRDRLLLTSHDRAIAGSPPVQGRVDVPTGPARYVDLADTTYRAVAADILSGPEQASLIALTPKSEIDEAVGDLRGRLFLFTFGTLAFVAVLAYAFGRTIVRSVKELSDAARAVALGRFSRRVRVRGHDEFALLSRAFNDMAAQLETRLEELAEERARVREATNRFGDALAATHDPRTLLPVIVESIVDATGAAGGLLVHEGRELARAGDPEGGGQPLAIELDDGNGGSTLLLYPADEDFSDESREFAHWLAGQAAVALENARLHRRVERQAITDGLTELPNRRQFEDALAAEVSRVERFGGSLALIFADLDDFKQVNDVHGHQAGDDVLRAFADVLRKSVRDIDVPARYGGEEFAILLPQTDLLGAENLAERIREDLAGAPVGTRAGPLGITASFGVASFPDEPTQAALFTAADQALYRAKRRGKNCVVVAGNGATVRRPR